MVLENDLQLRHYRASKWRRGKDRLTEASRTMQRAAVSSRLILLQILCSRIFFSLQRIDREPDEFAEWHVLFVGKLCKFG